MTTIALSAFSVLSIGSSRPASAYPSASVSFTGHGFGHGRGMGQYGSLGYALAGQPYTQILDHYYGGTHLGTINAGSAISVRLLSNDNHTLIALQERGAGTYSVNGAPAQPFGATAFRADLVGVNTFQLYRSADCAGGGGWVAVGAPVTGPISMMSTLPPSDDHTTMLQLCEASGGVRWYRGSFVTVDSGSGQRTVNSVGLDDYVRGVVPRESPASWGTMGGGTAPNTPGENALRAQAVAARSYGWSENRYPYAKTCDTTACQVYGGRAAIDPATGNQYMDLEGAAPYTNTSDAAVAQTAGQVRLNDSDNGVARTEFSSSTGGFSAGGTFPAVQDDGDATPTNPNHTWTASVAVSDIEAAYPIGSLQSVDITGRNGLGDFGGRVTQLVLRGTSASQTLTGEAFRSRFGLKSDWFAVTNGPSGGINGYWIVAPDGGIFSFGSAAFFGSMGGKPLNKPIVGMAATPSGNGYWEVASDGGIFSFGDARFFGSMGGKPLNKPIVGMSATPSGNGYWEVASDGGIFSFGDARFFGSMGGQRLNQPMVGMAATSSGNGYWTVASDGGIFSFGDAGFHGSTGSIRLARPVVGMASARSGAGYWLVAADGGLFAFDVPYFGSLPGIRAVDTAVAMRATATDGGYEIVANSGRLYAFGDAPFMGDVATAVPGYRGGVRSIDLKAGS